MISAFSIFEIASNSTSYDSPYVTLIFSEVISFSNFSTVIKHVALWFPSLVVTVIVALPTLKTTTKPLLFTNATVSSLDVHVTFLFVASSGKIDASNWTELLIFKEYEEWFNVTSST